MTAGQLDGQPTRLQRSVPGLLTVRSYQAGWLRSDVVAGVVLAAILVPQGMAYAELAGLPSGVSDGSVSAAGGTSQPGVVA